MEIKNLKIRKVISEEPKLIVGKIHFYFNFVDLLSCFPLDIPLIYTVFLFLCSHKCSSFFKTNIKLHNIVILILFSNDVQAPMLMFSS